MPSSITIPPKCQDTAMLQSEDLSVEERIRHLKRIATNVRKQLLQLICDGGSGHPGGSLSATDILTTLYFSVMTQKPHDPHWSGRDRFVLSKGHACPALYVILAELGYYSKNELGGFRKIGRMLQGHPEYGTPGIEVPTGSLGQGFSSAVGIALGLKWQQQAPRVYVLIGDGESQEGQVWEAVMAGSHHQLDNLTVIVDYNKIQQDGFLKHTRTLEPLADKWRAFNWAVREIDGHNIGEILQAMEWAQGISHQPQVIIAHTVKGKGVSYMENIPKWHGTKPPSAEEMAVAFDELNQEEARLNL